jgi:hypothetical protein
MFNPHIHGGYQVKINFVTRPSDFNGDVCPRQTRKAVGKLECLTPCPQKAASVTFGGRVQEACVKETAIQNS